MEDSLQLPQETLQNLEQVLKDLRFEKYSLKFSKGSAKGQNYLGIITKIQVTEEDDKKTPRQLNLIIKSAPGATEFREYIKIEILHAREVCMYESVFPELIKFQKEIGLEDIFDPFAKCYGTSSAIPHEHLIFEDMTAHGYVLKNRKNVIDLDHCQTVLTAYGQYHALALALRIKNPETYKTLSENTRESFFNNVNLSSLCKTIKGPIDKVINNLDESIDKKLIKKLNDFVNFPIDPKGLLENLSIEAAQGAAVFCHGDCWINNMLFKYEDDSSTPSAVCLLDWQLSRCASPAIDISYFIFACTDKKLRDIHYQHLLNIYHSSLTAFLIKLQVDPEIFSKETFSNHMKQFSKYGLMMCLIGVPLFVADLDEIPDWTGDMENGEREKMFSMTRKSEQYIVDKLTDIARDFDRLGYF